MTTNQENQAEPAAPQGPLMSPDQDKGETMAAPRDDTQPSPPCDRGLRCRFNNWVWATTLPGEPVAHKYTRAFFRVLSIVGQEFSQDRLTLRASALTLTVILSLVPMLALGTALLKGLGAGDQMRQAAYAFIDSLEYTQLHLPINNQQEDTLIEALTDMPEALPEQLPAAQLETETMGGPEMAGPEEAVPAPTPPAARPNEITPTPNDSLTIHLRRAVDLVFSYVEHTNFATLGALGVVGLLITVIAFLSSIEQALNVIWQAKQGRPISQQVMNYLGLMILLPVSIYVALATMAAIQSPTLLAKLQKLLPLGWIGANFIKLLPILAVVVTFTIIYKYLPSAHVRIGSAITGGLVGGLGWILVQSLYLHLQFGVARYNAIYGSFATLPLFLLWIYVAWIVFLTGAEVSFAAQSWRRYLRKHMVLTPLTRLALAFDIVDMVLADFKNRRTCNVEELSNRLRQPELLVIDVLGSLLTGGIIRQVSNETEEYVPAAPAEELRAGEIVDLILGTEVPKIRGGSLALTALRGARDALEDQSISRSL